MNKRAKFTVGGALLLGVGNGVINVINQLNSDEQFNWGIFLIAIGKGALVGGATGFVIGAVADHQNSLERPIDTDAILFSLAGKIRLSPNDRKYQSLSQKANWLVEVLKTEFSTELKDTPHRFGSTENGTALKEKFDIDICLPLKSDCFSSTAEMFDCVGETMEKYVGVNSLVMVSTQKKSIGVFFRIGGEDYKIDILPNKITKRRGNKSSGYLYVNNTGLFEKPTYTKTDVSLLKRVKLSETQKKILVILKGWKASNNVPLSSHLLQNLILDAYDVNYGRIPRKFTDKILLVLSHIADNINSVVLSSRENTNNVLTDIPDIDKDIIAKACQKLIDKYYYQPNSIVKIIQ